MKKTSLLLNTDSPAGAGSPAAAPVVLAALGVKGNMEAVVGFKDGLKFKLRYVSRSTLNRTVRACIQHVWDEKLKTRKESLNNDNFVEQFCRLAVLDWEGATLRVLSGLTPLNLEDKSDDELDALVPFTQENLVFLMKNCYDLDEFLQNAACDVKFFSTQKDDEVKN